jgi:uncharacterized repeat protein (TIGR01451 family)
MAVRLLIFFGVVAALIVAALPLISMDTPASAAPNLCFGVTDLMLTKTVSDATPDVDDDVVFTIVVVNHGPTYAAGGVSVKDQLPAGFQYVSHTVTRGAYDPATGIWVMQKNVNMGTAVILKITAKVVSISITGVASTAEIITAVQHDPDSTPNNHVPTEDDQSDGVTSFAGGGAVVQGGSFTPVITDSPTPVPTCTPSPTPPPTPCTPTPTPITPTPIVGGVTATTRPTRTPRQLNPHALGLTPTPTKTPASGVLGVGCITPSPTMSPTPTPLITPIVGGTTARPTRTPKP